MGIVPQPQQTSVWVGSDLPEVLTRATSSNRTHKSRPCLSDRISKVLLTSLGKSIVDCKQLNELSPNSLWTYPSRKSPVCILLVLLNNGDSQDVTNELPLVKYTHVYLSSQNFSRCTWQGHTFSFNQTQGHGAWCRHRFQLHQDSGMYEKFSRHTLYVSAAARSRDKSVKQRPSGRFFGVMYREKV